MHNPYIRKITVTLFCSLLMLGCTGNGGGRQTDGDSITADETPEAAVPKHIEMTIDSFKYSQHSANGTCEVHIDYPTGGPEEAVRAVRDFIKATLFEDGGVSRSDDPMQLVRDYCTERQEHLSKTLEQMDISNVSKDDAPEEGIDIRAVCLNDKFVTYEIYRFSYITHGAHGEYSDYGVTFRMSDGHRFGNDILNNMDEDLYSHIKAGMKSYFGVKTDAELQEICTTDLSLMPMPTFPPFLVRDGVRFHYSIYDVCGFDDGDPVITIPYSVIKPYLTKEAKEMIE